MSVCKYVCIRENIKKNKEANKDLLRNKEEERISNKVILLV
jgi:hypothetical protein